MMRSKESLGGRHPCVRDCQETTFCPARKQLFFLMRFLDVTVLGFVFQKGSSRADGSYVSDLRIEAGREWDGERNQKCNVCSGLDSLWNTRPTPMTLSTSIRPRALSAPARLASAPKETEEQKGGKYLRSAFKKYLRTARPYVQYERPEEIQIHKLPLRIQTNEDLGHRFLLHLTNRGLGSALSYLKIETDELLVFFKGKTEEENVTLDGICTWLQTAIFPFPFFSERNNPENLQKKITISLEKRGRWEQFSFFVRDLRQCCMLFDGFCPQRICLGFLEKFFTHKDLFFVSPMEKEAFLTHTQNLFVMTFSPDLAQRSQDMKTLCTLLFDIDAFVNKPSLLKFTTIFKTLYTINRRGITKNFLTHARKAIATLANDLEKKGAAQALHTMCEHLYEILFRKTYYSWEKRLSQQDLDPLISNSNPEKTIILGLQTRSDERVFLNFSLARLSYHLFCFPYQENIALALEQDWSFLEYILKRKSDTGALAEVLESIDRISKHLSKLLAFSLPSHDEILFSFLNRLSCDDLIERLKTLAQKEARE